MHLIHVALAPLLLAAGCAAIAPDPPDLRQARGGPNAAGHTAAAAKPSTETTPQPAPAVTPAPVAPTAAPQAENKAPAPGTKPGTNSGRRNKTAGGPAARVDGSKARAAARGRDVRARCPPTLDLAALKEQLKETKAIGVFTKITLKNQVDDLLQQFRDYYQGKAKITMVQLRRSYDLLLMKVLSLLQDADQKLAAAIVSSREAIWALLADPKKFATLEG